MSVECAPQGIRRRRRLEQQRRELLLSLAREAQQLDLSKRLLGGFLCGGHDEIADAATLDLGRAAHSARTLR